MTNGELGKLIRAARKKARLSQVRLAEILDMVPRTITAWENGENGGAWDHIQELEDALGAILPVSDETPSVSTALARLRAAAAELDLAREILHAIQASE